MYGNFGRGVFGQEVQPHGDGLDPRRRCCLAVPDMDKTFLVLFVGRGFSQAIGSQVKIVKAGTRRRMGCCGWGGISHDYSALKFCRWFGRRFRLVRLNRERRAGGTGRWQVDNSDQRRVAGKNVIGRCGTLLQVEEFACAVPLPHGGPEDVLCLRLLA